MTLDAPPPQFEKCFYNASLVIQPCHRSKGQLVSYIVVGQCKGHLKHFVPALDMDIKQAYKKDNGFLNVIEMH